MPRILFKLLRDPAVLPEFCGTVERSFLVFFPFGTSVESLLPVSFPIILFTQLFPFCYILFLISCIYVSSLVF